MSSIIGAHRFGNGGLHYCRRDLFNSSTITFAEKRNEEQWNSSSELPDEMSRLGPTFRSTHLVQERPSGQLSNGIPKQLSPALHTPHEVTVRVHCARLPLRRNAHHVTQHLYGRQELSRSYWLSANQNEHRERWTSLCPASREQDSRMAAQGFPKKSVHHSRIKLGQKPGKIIS
ncbi:hypothetical protein CC78DRAFT_576256 [Lojkania enalia]|uniref:Uncharacterized protein n=1 Tax=Lojkania enalia TaxID=147567 RepID=A0A9P4KHH3_9PLEO|nr:hypothetical protein CC78DRAFT_576256 [Didymosphaeria enalia]